MVKYMEPGHKIYIRNRAGKLTVHLVRQLDLYNVMTGIGEEKLPAMENPRLEFHEDRHGGRIVTLCDGAAKLPCAMYVAFWDSFEKPEIWECRLDETEEDEAIYETVTA